MKIRRLDLEKDYSLIASWWEKRGLPAVPKPLLSENGAFVEVDGKPLCAGWVYFDDNGKLGIVEGITTDPDAPWNETIGEAVDFLLNFFRHLATDREINNLISFVEDKSGLHRRMVRHGWQDPHSTPHIILFQSWPSPH